MLGRASPDAPDYYLGNYLLLPTPPSDLDQGGTGRAISSSWPTSTTTPSAPTARWVLLPSPVSAASVAGPQLPRAGSSDNGSPMPPVIAGVNHYCTSVSRPQESVVHPRLTTTAAGARTVDVLYDAAPAGTGVARQESGWEEPYWVPRGGSPLPPQARQKRARTEPGQRDVLSVMAFRRPTCGLSEAIADAKHEGDRVDGGIDRPHRGVDIGIDVDEPGGGVDEPTIVDRHVQTHLTRKSPG